MEKKWIRFLALVLMMAILPAPSLANESDGAPVMWPMSYSIGESIPKTLKFYRSASSIDRVLGMYRLVNDYRDFSSESSLRDRVENFSQTLKALERPVESYLYLVESSRTHPASLKFEMDSPAYKFLKKNLKVNHFGHLKYNTFQKFCDYFYTTDHHWNYKGSYQGYVDIVRMLKGADEQVLEPDGVAVFPFLYNGSYSQKSGKAISREPFAIYHFPEMPQYTSTINGKRKKYDNISSYYRGQYSKDTYANHYALCYGGDPGLMVMENQGGGSGVLLMFGNSQNSAVKTLLIHHYHQIVCVDLRYYQNSAGKPFSLQETVDQYNVGQILFLGDITMFRYGDLMNP